MLSWTQALSALLFPVLSQDTLSTQLVRQTASQRVPQKSTLDHMLPPSLLTQMKPANGNKNSGTDEPVCRAGIETQTQRMGMDAAAEGRGRRTGERH